MNGILIVNKDSGYTSRDVVNIIGRKFNTRKIGHTGTLDPLAKGVLVICMGECLKLVEFLTCDDKRYLATVLLGYSTDTLDVTGTKIMQMNPSEITTKEIKEVLKKFIGNIKQRVPLYSSVKVNGKKLYQYAREGLDVTLPIRDVYISKLELVSEIVSRDNCLFFDLDIEVSKGTYIRSLIDDIGHELGNLACMKDLVRTRQGIFEINNSYTLKDIEYDNYRIISKEEILSYFDSVTFDYEQIKKVKNGMILDSLIKDKYLVIKDLDGLVVAIYQQYDKDRSKMKPYRIF